MTQTEKDSLRDYIVSYLIAGSQTINGLESVSGLDENSSFLIIKKDANNKDLLKKASSSTLSTEFRFDSGYIQYKDIATGIWTNIISVDELASQVDLTNYVNKSGDQIIDGIKEFLLSPKVPLPNIGSEIANKQYVDGISSLKVDKTTTVNGHVLSENIIITKEDLGLGNVENISPDNYPIQDSVYALLNDKVNKTTTINNKNLSSNISINKSDIGLSDVQNIKPLDMPISTQVENELSKKSDKTITINAGNGLIGGGDLTQDRIIGINSANDGIVIGVDNIRLNTVDNLSSTHTTQPLSANQGKILKDQLDYHSNDISNPHNTTKAQVGLGNVDNTSDINKPISIATQNSLSTKADLVGGKIPTSQLPAYVDDVMEYANLATFPATGETGKIYVALDTNLTYRWSGSAYIEISKSLALGETSSTAYRGDRGKTAYDHSQATDNPHRSTATQIPNTPAGTIASTTVQGAINELDGDIAQVRADLNETISDVEEIEGVLPFKADLLNGTVPAEQLPPDLIRTTLYLTQVGHRKRRIQDSLGVEDGTMLWDIVSGTEYLATLPYTLELGLYLVSQDLSTYKKLNKTNSNFYEDGTPAKLDGTEGDIQMCWRKPIYVKYYEKQEADGLYEHIEISHLNILGECEMIVPGGGFPAVLNRTTGDLRALYSTDPNFRGGNNTASYDSDPVKTLIGKPATNLSAYSGEVAAKKRGALWTTGGTPFFATLAIFQIMLFGTNDAQGAIVTDDVLVDGEGFQTCKKDVNKLFSGGFGVSNGFPSWSTYNANNPTFDLSAAFSRGDITGKKVYKIKDWPTVGTNQTISIAYFFGMPYPFNHYWHGDAHQRVDQQTEAQGFKTVVYQKRDITAAPISGGPSLNGVVPPAPWEKVAEASRTEGYIRRTSFNALCLIPTVAGSPGASNKFYPDYFYNNGATSFGWRAPIRFASLGLGAYAGAFYVNVYAAPTIANAHYGAFCCHFISGTVPKKMPG